jgi:hypothetical protein
MDLGIQQAAKSAPKNPLSSGWLGRATAPLSRPDWSAIAGLTAAQHTNLLAQIGYDKSAWDYEKIGTSNELGRYQISPATLEEYSLLVAGSYASYGADAVNYRHVWRQPNNTYANYLEDISGLNGFLSNPTAQELLAYGILLNLYNEAVRVKAIQTTDGAETLAGMLYVAWQLGAGSMASSVNPTGTGAFAWRYFNEGSGADYYNAGRYAIAVLSK